MTFEQLLCTLQTHLKCNMLESCTFPYGVGNEIALCVLNLRWHRQLCLLCVYTSENPSSPSFILSLLAETHIWKEHSVSTCHKTSCIFFLWYLRRPKAGKPRKSCFQKSCYSWVPVNVICDVLYLSATVIDVVEVFQSPEYQMVGGYICISINNSD